MCEFLLFLASFCEYNCVGSCKNSGTRRGNFPIEETSHRTLGEGKKKSVYLKYSYVHGYLCSYYCCDDYCHDYCFLLVGSWNTQWEICPGEAHIIYAHGRQDLF